MPNRATGPDGRKLRSQTMRGIWMHGGYRRVMTGVLFVSCGNSWEAVWKAGKKLEGE